MIIEELSTWLQRPGTGCTDVQVKENVLKFEYYGTKSEIIESSDIIELSNSSVTVFFSWLRAKRENGTSPIIVLKEEELLDLDKMMVHFIRKDEIEPTTDLQALKKWCQDHNLRVEEQGNEVVVSECLRGNTVTFTVDSDKTTYKGSEKDNKIQQRFLVGRLKEAVNSDVHLPYVMADKSLLRRKN